MLDAQMLDQLAMAVVPAQLTAVVAPVPEARFQVGEVLARQDAPSCAPFGFGYIEGWANSYHAATFRLLSLMRWHLKQ
jgi:hypothetical protein